MMIFTSIYGVVDGFFVSNYAGKTPFAAVNFIFPFIMILGTFGFMFGTGGSALVSMKFGQKEDEEANRIFSFLTYFSVGLGIVIALLGVAFMRPVAKLMGAEGEMLEQCVLYGRVSMSGLPFFMLQMQFQSFFVTAERPKLGLVTTIAAGVANMLGDWLLVGVLDLGVVGAALATVAGQFIGGIIPVIYFISRNSSILRLGHGPWNGRALLKTCTNGSSELMSNISMSLVGMLYNIQLMKYAGEDGVAAYGVLMYVNMIFIACFIGYAVGTAPVVGYNFGARNHDELKSLLKKSFVIIGVTSVLMLIAGELLGRPLSLLFAGYDEDLLEMTHHAFVIFSFSFLFAGISIYGSSFFTALNDGLTSAIISFLRTIVFQTAAVMLMPPAFGLDGIWYSIIVAEFMSVVATFIFLIAKRKKYGYA